MAKKSTMFDKAATVEIKSAAVEKAAKDKTKEVALGEKLDYLSAIRALSKSLEAIGEVYYKEVTAVMADEFTTESMALQKRPDSFKGTGTYSEATCIMGKRATSSPLKPEEVAILDQHLIKHEEVLLAEEIPERYFFNPEILNESSIAEKISEKLSEIPELAGKEVIMKQAKREKTTKKVVHEDAFDQIAKLTDPVLVKQLLMIVSSLSVKPKLTTQDITVVMDLVRKSGVKL